MLFVTKISPSFWRETNYSDLVARTLDSDFGHFKRVLSLLHQLTNTILAQIITIRARNVGLLLGVIDCYIEGLVELSSWNIRGTKSVCQIIDPLAAFSKCGLKRFQQEGEQSFGKSAVGSSRRSKRR